MSSPKEFIICLSIIIGCGCIFLIIASIITSIWCNRDLIERCNASIPPYDIKRIQQQLNISLNINLPVDGKLTKETFDAIMLFKVRLHSKAFRNKTIDNMMADDIFGVYRDIFDI